MLYVLTQTPGLSSLGWSPTGFHTTWTTHRQNGDNLIYSSCTLGRIEGVFCIVCADKGKRGYPRCEEFPQLHRGYSDVPDSHKLQTHTHYVHYTILKYFSNIDFSLYCHMLQTINMQKRLFKTIFFLQYLKMLVIVQLLIDIPLYSIPNFAGSAMEIIW